MGNVTSGPTRHQSLLRKHWTGACPVSASFRSHPIRPRFPPSSQRGGRCSPSAPRSGKHRGAGRAAPRVAIEVRQSARSRIGLAVLEAFASASARLRFAPQRFRGNGRQNVAATAESPSSPMTSLPLAPYFPAVSARRASKHVILPATGPSSRFLPPLRGAREKGLKQRTT